jgi:hypothetical protein
MVTGNIRDPLQADAVELALADAVTKAASGGRWEVLPVLVKELEARRQARTAPEIISLDAARRQRGGS